MTDEGRKDKETKEKSNLEELKEKYDVLRIRHNLPSFDELNKEFSIEKIADNETDFLIREISKPISEKVSNYLRIVEAFLNPSNSPLFIFSIVKLMDEKDRKTLSEIYSDLSKFEIRIIELDTGFSEKKHAEFIIDFYNSWINLKKDFLSVIEKIKLNWDNKKENNNKAYFG